MRKTILAVTTHESGKLEIFIEPTHFKNLYKWAGVLAAVANMVTLAADNIRKKNPAAIPGFSNSGFYECLREVLERPNSGITGFEVRRN